MQERSPIHTAASAQNSPLRGSARVHVCVCVRVRTTQSGRIPDARGQPALPDRAGRARLCLCTAPCPLVPLCARARAPRASLHARALACFLFLIPRSASFTPVLRVVHTRAPRRSHLCSASFTPVLRVVHTRDRCTSARCTTSTRAGSCGRSASASSRATRTRSWPTLRSCAASSPRCGVPHGRQRASWTKVGREGEVARIRQALAVMKEVNLSNFLQELEQRYHDLVFTRYVVLSPLSLPSTMRLSSTDQALCWIRGGMACAGNRTRRPVRPSRRSWEPMYVLRDQVHIGGPTATHLAAGWRWNRGHRTKSTATRPSTATTSTTTSRRRP